MYTGQKYIWNDLSQINQTKTTMQEDYQPLTMMVSSSEKGPEELMLITSPEEFESLYGSNNKFESHGQPIIQAKAILDAGGALLFKRLVASDASLANLILLLKIKSEETQKVDENGNLLYLDSETGFETTDVTDTPLLETNVYLKWDVSTVSNASDYKDVKIKAAELLDEHATDGYYTYPMFCFCDNGRGVSQKRVKIIPDYTASKNLDFIMYKVQCVEGSTIIEGNTFSADPSVIYNNMSKSMNKTLLTQIRCEIIDNITESAVSKIADLAGYTYNELIKTDFLFGRSKDNKELPSIILEDDSVPLNYVNGILLQQGDNGAFGNHPFGSNDYIQQGIKFWSGEYTDDIFDIDRYQIDFIPDANYPSEFKRQIEELVDLREDAFYFRDLGLGLSTLDQIIDADKASSKNKFCASYLTTYDVYDPVTRKQVNVTMMYDFAPLLVNHFANGRFRPLAGEFNNLILTSAIEGTVNFIPKITKTVNQKTMLEDTRINYAAYNGASLVVETLYTSQELYTQLSYINNVLSIQEVAKAIRLFCPKVRFQFADGSDFSAYKEAIEPIITKYRSNFKELTFIYTQNPEMANQKIFSADLEFLFNNFVQSEIFNIYAKIEY